MTTMPYTTWVRRRTCTGKTKWKNETKAQRSAEKWAAVLGEPISRWACWQCLRCSWWHSGHKPGVRRG